MGIFSSQSEEFDWAAILAFRRGSRAVTLTQGRNPDRGSLDSPLLKKDIYRLSIWFLIIWDILYRLCIVFMI
jgi:hypothetical protein